MEYYFLPRKGNSTIGGTINPSVNEEFNLGSADRRFDVIYARQVIADTFTGSQGTDADTVDGFHASATPTTGYLLPLGTGAEFPLSVIATHTNNVDAHHAGFVGLINPSNVNVSPDANDRIKFDQGNGLLVSSAGSTFTHAVNQGYPFVWTAQHVFDAGLRLNDADRINFGTDSDQYMQFYKNDVTDNDIGIHGGLRSLSPDWQSETIGWHISYEGNADFRRIFADELHVRAFIADIEQALAGGQIISKSVAILYQDFTAPTSINGTAYLYVEDLPGFFGYQAFQSGDYIRMRFIDRENGGLIVDDIWGTVASYVDQGNGYQRWTFTLKDGPITGVVIRRGAIVVDYGTTGQGYWEVTTIDTQYSPYAQVVTWATNPWTPANRTIRTRMGKLDGITDPDMTPSGWGLYSDNAFLNGSLVAANGEVIIDTNGITIEGVALDSTALKWSFPTVGESVRYDAYKVSDVIGAHVIANNESVGGGSYIQLSADGDNQSTVGIRYHNTTLADRYVNVAVDGNNVVFFYKDNIKLHQSITKNSASTVDIGEDGTRIDNLYVTNLYATNSEVGGALTGQRWSYAGDMYINPENATANSTLYIAHRDGSYIANLDVEGSITLGGNVDGVDLAGFKSTYDTHAGNVNAHHNRSHSVTSTSDHTITGSYLAVLGATATDTLGLITPYSNPGTSERLLKTNSDGNLQLNALGFRIAPDNDQIVKVQGIETAGNTMYGGYFRVYKRATGDAVGTYGSLIADQADIAITNLMGLQGRSQASGTGTASVASLYGVYGHGYNPSGTVSITDFYGGFFLSQHDGTGSVGTQYGVYAQLSKGASAPSATTAYGVRSWMPADIATTKYAFQSNLGTVFFNSDKNADSDFRVDGDTVSGVLFVDATYDNVGIGTTTPNSSYRLSVSGQSYFTDKVGIGGTPATNAQLFVRWVNDNTSGNWYGIYSPVYNRYAGANAISMGLYAYADTAIASGSMWGFYSSVSGASTGGSSGTLMGTDVRVAISNSHSATSLIGHRVSVVMDGTGTLTTATGLEILAFTKSATATPTNAYGINVGNISVGSNNYAIMTNLGKIVFNNGAGDADVQMKGSGQQNLFYLDASENKIGILDSTPYYTFDVVGDIRTTTGLYIGTGDPTASRIFPDGSTNLVIHSTTGNVYLGNSQYLNLPDSGGGTSTILAGGTAHGVGLYSKQPIAVGSLTISPLAMIMAYSTTTPLLLLGYDSTHYLDVQVSASGDATVSTTDDLVLDPGGNVGINKSAPTAKLDVVGSVLIDGGSVTINESGEDYDFRVEGLDYAHLLFVDASANTVGINKSSPIYTLDMWGNARFMGPSNQVGMTYDGTFHTWFDASATGSIEITTATGIIFDPGSHYVNPGGNIEDDLGAYNTMWRSLYAAELVVQNFVQQDIQATIGGAIRVAPTTSLTRALGSGDTTIYLEHAAPGFVNGTYIIMQGWDATGNVSFEAMQLTSAGTDEGDDYSFTVTRNLDGTGANSWSAGTAVVSTGDAIGEGHIDLTSTQTLYSHIGPTIALYVRTATTNWNDVKPVVALGNLYSFLGYGSDTYGMAIGNDLSLTTSTFRGATITNANGLQLYNTDITLYDSAVAKVQVKYNEGILVSSGAWDEDTTVFAAVFANDNDVANLDAGDVIIGSPFHATPTSARGVHWDNSDHTLDVWGSLHLYGDSTFEGIVTIATAGELRQGTGTWGSSFTGLRLWNDTGVGRIGGYNNEVLQWYGSTDGKLYAGLGKVVLDSAGMAVYNVGAGVTWRTATDILGDVRLDNLYYTDWTGTPLVITASKTTPTNQVTNAGFESGDTAWDKAGFNSYSIAIDTNSPVVNGSYSAKLEAQTTGDLVQSYCTITTSSYITAVPGSIVFVEGWYYNYSNAGTWNLQIIWYNSSNSVISTAIIWPNNNLTMDWYWFSRRSSAAPANTAKYKLRMYVENDINGTTTRKTVFDEIVAYTMEYDSTVELGKNYVLFDIGKTYQSGFTFPSPGMTKPSTGFTFAGGDVSILSNDLWLSTGGYINIGVSGSESNLYRSASLTLRTNSSFVSDGAIYATLDLFASSGLVVGSSTGTPGTGEIFLNNSNTKISEGASDSVRVTTPYGYVDIGAQNGSFLHLRTDLPEFYMDKPLVVNGDIHTYQNGFTNITSSCTITGWSGSPGTSSYVYAKRVGNLQHVWWFLDGTNYSGTAVSILLPSTEYNSAAAVGVLGTARVNDAGGGFVMSMAVIGSGTRTITMYKSAATSVWTASAGQRYTLGYICYEIA
jgi:hypothetical protein